MVDGGVFRPIPSKTPLGVTEHHPYGPFCNFKHGRNPIFDEMVAFCPDLWLSLVRFWEEVLHMQDKTTAKTTTMTMKPHHTLFLSNLFLLLSES